MKHDLVTSVCNISSIDTIWINHTWFSHSAWKSVH